jgi:SfnB family sulfur acquisition oxidoreductase
LAAHRIQDDDEAVAVATELAAGFAAGASERDARRQLPVAEVDALSGSGLLAITVPAGHGGADVTAGTVLEVFRLLAAADPSIAQIPQSHMVYVNVLKQQGSAGQQRFFFAEILAGKRLGNAQSEKGGKHVQDYRTRLRRTGPGVSTLDGEKFYATGALMAHWIPVLARDDGDNLVVAYVPRDAAGVEVIDDWNGMGQRTTASGTVRLTGVQVPDEHVVPHHLTFTGPQLHGSQAQALHAAIDAGIARGALAAAAEFVRTTSRPWFEAGVASAVEDPLTVQRVGELAVTVAAAEALLRDAGAALDAARADLTDASAAAASIAVATAKAYAATAAVDVANGLFELAGTRSAADDLNLHRFWRDARTHSLHDPVRWKLQHIGRYVLTGTPPPRHGVI